jgi:hypothetical protein
MSNHSQQIVQKLWSYCNVLRDDELSYGDYVEQLTCLRRSMAAPPLSFPTTFCSRGAPARRYGASCCSETN